MKPRFFGQKVGLSGLRSFADIWFRRPLIGLAVIWVLGDLD